MAYMNQERKKVIAQNIKPVMKKYGLRGTLSVRNHRVIVLTLRSGKIDFGTTNADVNPYWYHEHYSGQQKEAIGELLDALKSADWYDKSDAQIDYFNTAYYVDLNIGKWGKPYKVVA